MVEAFRDSTDILEDGSEVLRRLTNDGYVFLRGVLPSAPLRSLKLELLGIANEHGWLQAGELLEDSIADPKKFCVEPEVGFRRVWNEMYQLEPLHNLGHHPQLVSLFQRILGEPILIHPRLILRLVFPRREGPESEDFTTPAHQDYPYVQGTAETFTTWVPLDDCELGQGPLSVAHGSHRSGVLPFRLALGPGGVEVIEPFEGRWVSGNFRLGDVLVFHSLTVHRALPNLTRKLRISVDFRYQRLRDPICEESLRLAQEDLNWKKIYSSWNSTNLQYYWGNEPYVVPFDRQYVDRRDEIAFDEAQKGNRLAVAALQRIVAYDPEERKRERASTLLQRFTEARSVAWLGEKTEPPSRAVAASRPQGG